MDELIDYNDKEEARSSEETDALEVTLSFLHVLTTFTVTLPALSSFNNRALMSGGEAGDRAGSDPEGRERAAAAATTKHHLLPSGSRRELQSQVGGRRPGAELPREDPPTLHGRGSHRRRARNRHHRARRS
jgi:hypothetical protein